MAYISDIKQYWAVPGSRLHAARATLRGAAELRLLLLYVLRYLRSELRMPPARREDPRSKVWTEQVE